jgi:hypothetical protein
MTELSEEQLAAASMAWWVYPKCLVPRDQEMRETWEALLRRGLVVRLSNDVDEGYCFHPGLYERMSDMAEMN